MIDFWFKANETEVRDGINWPRYPSAWSVRCFSSFRLDDGTWVVRLYLDHDTWGISMPSYGEHLNDTGAATAIANVSPHDWTAESVNESFRCGVASTHFEPRDTGN